MLGIFSAVPYVSGSEYLEAGTYYDLPRRCWGSYGFAWGSEDSSSRQLPPTINLVGFTDRGIASGERFLLSGSSLYLTY